MSFPPGDDRSKGFSAQRPIVFPPKAHAPASKAHEPGWAVGLRKLYDSVLHEPLPDTFGDLLKKLDQDGDA